MPPAPIPSVAFCDHHVGGRDGNKAFPTLSRFEKDFVHVLYDADADCCPQAAQKWAAGEARTLVLPYCLADRAEKKTLHITYDPYSSSLLEPNPAYGGFYASIGTYDALIRETSRVMERRPVDSTTIDALVSNGTAPAPDFLSIDVQGCTYEVLLGAAEALRTTTIGLLVEAEFHEYYKGEKLFGDISRLATEKGFHFAHFERISQHGPHLAPLGFRGTGFDYHADALFLRSIESVLASGPDDDTRYLLLRKLAFASLVLNQTEYAVRCLEAARTLSPSADLLHALASTAYDPFLQGFDRLLVASPQTFPPRLCRPLHLRAKPHPLYPPRRRAGKERRTAAPPAFSRRYRSQPR